MSFIRIIITTIAMLTSITSASNLDGMTREEMSVFIDDMPKAELQAKSYKQYLIGLDLNSGPEETNPPSKFKG